MKKLELEVIKNLEATKNEDVRTIRIANPLFKQIDVCFNHFMIYDFGWDVEGYHSFQYQSIERLVKDLEIIFKVMEDKEIPLKDYKIDNISPQKVISII